MAGIVRQKLTRDQVAIIVGDEPGQPQRIRAFEDLVASVITDPAEAISSPVSGNTTYTISNVIGFQSILIRKSNLVASAGGPFLLTITTGSGSVVIVPIAPFGDTILSDDLLFDVYIDSSGNVISKDWEISGSGPNGAYILNQDGQAQEYAKLTSGAATQTWIYPFPLNAAPDFVGSIAINAAARFVTIDTGTPVTSTQATTLGWTDAGVASGVDRYVELKGRWRA